MAVQTRLLETERAAHIARENFSSQLLQAQDGERKRLAGELHDGVGQNLSFLANAFRQLEKNCDHGILENASRITREAVNEIRFISHQLHPHILDQLGLVAAIESIAERIEEQTQLRCDVIADIKPEKLDADTQLHIYRIVQESLNNAVKHSQANHIEVRLEQQGNNIVLSIADNGCGLSSPPSNTGLGLESIKHRVTLSKGRLELKANTPHGLIVFITLPVPEQT